MFASKPKWLELKVVAKQLEATDIYSYELADPKGRPLPPFSAGAHLDVQVRGRIVRQYSLCNSPQERHRYLIAVLKDPNSRGGSLAMHERIEVGDLLDVSEPKNHFPLDSNARHSLLFAGGIGVTPILSMAEQLTQQGASFEMHYCARAKTRMAFIERIKQTAFATRVHFHLDDGDAAQRLDLSAVLANAPADTHLYVCGPVAFMKWVIDSARQAGWPEALVHREFFGAEPLSNDSNTAFEVELASDGQVIAVAADQTIVQALSQHGVDVPVSCEQGVCGTCLTRVLAGEPDHRDVYLTEAERARNDVMLPCCSRSRSARLVLDL